MDRPISGTADPVKEITAEQLACENGFSTREQSTVRLNGGSFEANAEQLKDENKLHGNTQSGGSSGADPMDQIVEALLPRILSKLSKGGSEQ